MMTEIAAPKIKFYTTACANKDIDDLKPMLAALDAVLIDVRFSSTAETLRWRQIYLKALLREKYYHIPPLGNRDFRGQRNQIQNLDLGVKILISLSANAILMCGCADLNVCHRRVIAEELWRRGFETKEISDWKPFAAIL